MKTDGSNSDCASATSKTDCDQATTSGGAANAANACVFTADTYVQKERATSWCKDGESMSADPATPAKCSSIPGTLAWCKTADANKFTNGLKSDSKGVPVVGLMCKANPCTPADDGATCCEDTSGSGGGCPNGVCSAKCSDISDPLAWCKTADAKKFTNGLKSDSKGVPVVGLECNADPCTPADDGKTCCEDTLCRPADIIVSKDQETTDTARIAQCYNAEFGTTDPGGQDPSKWIYKKGKGSCSVCSDALKIKFGSKCDNKDGKCKHCPGLLSAYKDCDVVPVPKFAIAHTIALEGVSATEFMADPKIILSFQESIATTLKVDVDKIVNIKAKSSRRQLSGRGMAAAGCRYI